MSQTGVIDSARKGPREADDGGDMLIRFVGVSKSFGALRVLDKLDLDLRRGQRTVIMGPSGTGKSVLLKHIVGLIRPDAGEVWFGGQRIDHLDEANLVAVRKQIGFLFQMGALFDSMTVAQNVCFPLAQHGDIPEDKRIERCRQVLALVGLPEVENKMPGELSGGQRKRVALARAIALEPKVVLYDEPTTGLDPIRAAVINELIVSLSERLGITSIVVTHDVESARRIAERMVMLYDGNIIADGNLEAFEKSDNDLVRRFVRGEADQEDLDRIHGRFQAQR